LRYGFASNSNNGTVTIAAGSTTASIYIQTDGDNLDEADESIALELFNPSGSASFAGGGNTLSALGFILDDDGSTVADLSLAGSAATVGEDYLRPQMLEIPVELSRISDSEQTFSVRAIDGTAVAGRDYTLVNTSVTFAAGQTVAAVRVKILPDAEVEPTENFELHFSHQSGRAFSGQATPVSVEIRNHLIFTEDSDDIRLSNRAENVHALDGDDIVRAKGGNDVVKGGDGNDQIFGGGGTDKIFGQSGNDRLIGNGGQDRLLGAGGSDTIKGGGGADTVKGGGSSDQIKGGGHNDLLIGNGGTDQLFGNAGNDTLKGSAGKDQLNGGGGSDILSGGGGADRLVGGKGHDQLSGNAGHDFLEAGRGNDTLSGNAGADTFAFSRGHGKDVVTDFEVGIDTIEIGRGASRMRALDFVQDGSDVVVSFRNVEITFEDITVSEIRDADNFLFT
jgi:Ca2+-binding RTX toxin-like protein